MTPLDERSGRVSTVAIAERLTATGQRCGSLEPELAARMADLDEGAILEVVVDEPSVPAGVAAWCRLTGHELLPRGPSADDEPTVLHLRKGGR